MEVHRGEVFYADLSPVVGSEQGGVRPVLIVQNEIGNRHSPTVIAAAITSRLDKARLPTHINIRAEDPGRKGGAMGAAEAFCHPGSVAEVAADAVYHDMPLFCKNSFADLHDKIGKI